MQRPRIRGSGCHTSPKAMCAVTLPNVQPRKHLNRIERPNQARFLTFSCYQRLPLFNNDKIKDAFADRLLSTTEHTHLTAWVVMPEHVHLLVTPADRHAFDAEAFLRRLKTPFARQVIDRWRDLDAAILEKLSDKQGRSRFWQPGGGYDRSIAGDKELRVKAAYIEANPVRRGLADRPADYRWSSAG